MSNLPAIRSRIEALADWLTEHVKTLPTETRVWPNKLAGYIDTLRTVLALLAGPGEEEVKAALQGERETAHTENMAAMHDAGAFLEQMHGATLPVRIRMIVNRDAAIRAQAAAEATQAKAELAGLREAYNAVALWPEEDPQGWAKMLDLRQAVERLLAASAVPGDGKWEG